MFYPISTDELSSLPVEWNKNPEFEQKNVMKLRKQIKLNRRSKLYEIEALKLIRNNKLFDQIYFPFMLLFVINKSQITIILYCTPLNNGRVMVPALDSVEKEKKKIKFICRNFIIFSFRSNTRALFSFR